MSIIFLIFIISIFVGNFYGIRQSHNKQTTQPNITSKTPISPNKTPGGIPNNHFTLNTTPYIVTVSEDSTKTENDYKELTNSYFQNSVELIYAIGMFEQGTTVFDTITTSYNKRIEYLSEKFYLIIRKLPSNRISENNALLYLSITASQLILERYNILSELNKHDCIKELISNSKPEEENTDATPITHKLYKILLKEKIFLPFYKLFHHEWHLIGYCKPFLCEKLGIFEIRLATKTKSTENWIRAKNFVDFTVFLSLKRIEHNELNYYIINDIDLNNYSLIEIIFIVINLYSETDDNGFVKLNILGNKDDIKAVKKDNVVISEIEKITKKIHELTSYIMGIIFQVDDQYDLNKVLEYTMDLVMQ